MLNYFLLLVAIIVSNIALIYGYNEPRIQNGEITPPDLFQFAAYFHGWGSMCTASIISKRYILTAAHCIEENDSLKIEYDRYRIYLKIPYFVQFRPVGSNYDKLSMPMSIKAFIPITKHGTDIGILEFPEGTDFGIEPVKLAKDYLEKEGDEVYITGFGLLNNTTPANGILHHVKTKIVPTCFGTLKICGGNKTHLGRPGDSGGPMVINRNNKWYQIGVASGGGDYDARVRVSSFCNFIEETTKNEVKCESIYYERKNQILPPLKHFEPLYKGQSTPLKLFDFVVPLYNYYYKQGCTATRHFLTSGWCVYRDWWTNENKDIHLKEHSSYKTITGKLFPDLRSKNVQPNLNNDPMDVTAYIPSNYKWPWDHNLAVIEFPVGTDFEVAPVNLPYDYVQVYLEKEVVIAGYGKYEFKYDMHMKESSPILKHSSGFIEDDGVVERRVVLENKNLMGDEGGPTLYERNGKFYQIGINFHEGTPNGSRTVVSSHCDFIEKVTKEEVKCESIAPMYERPYKLTPENLESTNNFSVMIKFNMLSLIFVIILFCL